MPADLLKHFENVGFVLTISGQALYSVALDESHNRITQHKLELQGSNLGGRH